MKEQLNINTIIRTRKDRFGKVNISSFFAHIHLMNIQFISLQTQEYNSEQLYHARSIILNHFQPHPKSGKLLSERIPSILIFTQQSHWHLHLNQIIRK